MTHEISKDDMGDDQEIWTIHVEEHVMVDLTFSTSECYFLASMIFLRNTCFGALFLPFFSM
jgi:hypothetical protein